MTVPLNKAQGVHEVYFSYAKTKYKVNPNNLPTKINPLPWCKRLKTTKILNKMRVYIYNDSRTKSFLARSLPVLWYHQGWFPRSEWKISQKRVPPCYMGNNKTHNWGWILVNGCMYRPQKAIRPGRKQDRNFFLLIMSLFLICGEVAQIYCRASWPEQWMDMLVHVFHLVYTCTHMLLCLELRLTKIWAGPLTRLLQYGHLRTNPCSLLLNPISLL